MHTRESLRNAVRDNLGGKRVVVVSNRQPFSHERQNGEIVCRQPASGLTTALDPILRATSGLWVAHGSGSADRLVVDPYDHVRVPPERPSYTLRRVWLTAEQERGYYRGFSNQALWPLCHVACQQPAFSAADWRMYGQVNELFADVLSEEIGGGDAVVFIQDYHFALLARLLKRRCPRAVVTQFWHIPWPNPEVFRICPWKETLLEGLLGNDVLGFHLRRHCLNFLGAVAGTLAAAIDEERLSVEYQGHTTRVRPFPISVDFEDIQASASSPRVPAEMEALRARYGLDSEFLGLGVDRLDYTKGISERLRAVDRFLELHPLYQERFTFLQVGVPSRRTISAYAELERRLDALVSEINRKHERHGWRPIVFVKHHLAPETLHVLYRLAHVCVVSSLHDGMNLVAKEFVSARTDGQGVLVLSRFTGAAREMSQALLVNPYALEEFANTLWAALEMEEGEQRQRMRRLRDTVARNNIYTWATSIVNEVGRVAAGVTDDEALMVAVETSRTAAAGRLSRPFVVRF
jgi:trehalose 6-phosphate synthase